MTVPGPRSTWPSHNCARRRVAMGCLQMQQRLKKMQENIHMLVDGPLKTAEATFELERSELRGRIVQLEQESAQLKAEHRGTLRPLTLSQFISSMHCA